MIQQYLSGASTEPQGYLNGDSMGLNQHYNLKFSNFSFRYLFEVNFFFHIIFWDLFNGMHMFSIIKNKNTLYKHPNTKLSTYSFNKKQSDKNRLVNVWGLLDNQTYILRAVPCLERLPGIASPDKDVQTSAQAPSRWPL